MSLPLARPLAMAHLTAVLAGAVMTGTAPAQVETTALCRGGAPAAAAADRQEVHAGAWSYFGDPRSIAHGSRVFTGCIGTDRGIIVHQYDRHTSQTSHVHLHRNRELDDHDNPSLALWRKRVYAFYSPHSGRVFPLDRHSEMHYRASKRPFDIRHGFGLERHVRTNTPGGLGFTYPNPVPTRDKLWLFWRGGNWYPSFSYTRDGVHWAPARTLVRGPARQRPYAKYVGGTDGSIHMVFSEAHPQSYRTSLYYLRYTAGRFYRADGRLVGRMSDLPLRTSQADRLYSFSTDVGRAWPHDIALAGNRRPVVVYTGRTGGPDGRDTFHYARWDGSRWRSHPIVAAGPGAKTFRSGGITVDHARPSWVVLSRTVGRWNEVELWRTRDDGQSWLPPYPLTSGSDAHNYRPAIPRGYTEASSLIVLYVHGVADSFRNFQTVIRMDVQGALPRSRSIDPR